MVSVGWPRAEFDEHRRHLEASFWDVLARFGIEERVRAGRRQEPLRGTGDVPNRYRRSHGPGWALIGDAGYYKDPVTALGIADAFRDAEAVAGAIHSALAGKRPVDEALADYEARRDAATRAHFEFTTRVARLPALDPASRAMLSGFRDHADLAEGYFRVFAGLLEWPRLFTPENVTRAVSGPSAIRPQA
ncbi:MAG TPA: hydroxylase [Actinomycetota bacterium]|nr:hydroxylase [Actinomycetota bacterium]